MRDINKELGETVGAIFAATGGIVWIFALAVLVITTRGIAMAWLWKWFMVPLGVPHVTLAGAIGICLLFTLVEQAPTVMKTKEGKEATLTRPFYVTLIHPLIAVGIGWIIHLFM